MNTTASRTDFLHQLLSSRFNYWFGYVVNLSLVVWFGSHAVAERQVLVPLPQWVLFAIAGYLIWCGVEYLTHRYIYHNLALVGIGHNLHHENPKSLLGIPWYLTTLVILGIFHTLALVCEPAQLGLFMAFFWLFYIAYCFVHHCIHHVRFKNPLLRSLQKHHFLHHVRPDLNFSILMPVLDRVFCTLYQKPENLQGSGQGDRPSTQPFVKSSDSK